MDLNKEMKINHLLSEKVFISFPIPWLMASDVHRIEFMEFLRIRAQSQTVDSFKSVINI